jgi:dTDP-4-amino-4,6-dideoxygalactose transaminase
MKIGFVDLKRQYDGIKPEIDQAISDVLDETSFILGEKVKGFEKEFAAFCRSRHCIGVDSGTSALALCLEACGVGAGDEVLTVPNTFIATVLSISWSGARPIFVPIDPDTYTMDPERIEGAITNKTKAIMPVHLYGQVCDMKPITEIAEKHDLKIVEDACQAHGAERGGKRAGSFGDAAAFSFYPGKNLGAYGDGGAVVTGNAEIDKRIRMLRDYGQKKKYHHEMMGYNRRLDGLQAAILSVKLKRLDEWNDMRRANAKLYYKLLDVPGKRIRTPVEAPDSRHIYHIYALRTDSRDGLMRLLGENGIASGIHYPIPVHMQKAYSGLGYKRGDFPITEKYAGQILSIPMFPELKKEEIEFIAEMVNSYQNSSPKS